MLGAALAESAADAVAEGDSAVTLPNSGLSSPSHDGNFCPTTMSAPAATTSMSAAMNASSFWSVDGPRLRTTTVGFFGRRGRSAMRIVGCAGKRCTGNAGGVCGYEGCEAIGAA